MTLLPTLFAFCAFLGCLFVSALASGLETAVISADRYRFRQRHEDGDEQAGHVLGLLAATPRVIMALLVANNAVNVMAALLFKLIIDMQWPAWGGARALGFIHRSEAASILVLTPLIVIFAEVLPKAYSRARADALVVNLRPALSLLLTLLHPAVLALDFLLRLALKPFGGHQAMRGSRITRRDVITLLNPPPRFEEEEEGAENEDEKEKEKEKEKDDEGGEGEARQDAEPEKEVPSFMREPDERLLIRNIIQLEQTVVGEIMQPLIALEAVHLGHITMEEFLAQARQSGYSRYPVYRHRIVNIIGHIDVYDVIKDGQGRTKLDDFVKPGYYVPETKRVDDLLQEFLEKRIKNAIVVDEYGGCCGWVSREDILEEIVGELEDELDLPEPLVHAQEDGSYLLDGRLGVDNLNEVLGTKFDEPYCDTLGGLLMKHMGRIPRAGEMIVLQGWRMEIREMKGMRVKLVMARLAES